MSKGSGDDGDDCRCGAKRSRIDSYAEAAGAQRSGDEEVDDDESSDSGDVGAESKESFSTLVLASAILARILDCRDILVWRAEDSAEGVGVSVRGNLSL